ncbi:MAG: hypothetical protein KHX84_20095 [Enterocloster asparagiformis]|jgi:hypothetical protein|nr:hypothetical protein [Enterocloster asparagiformis]DAZ69938.1 MAG TPA: hypothetical protein [Caudoviricetes sp.]
MKTPSWCRECPFYFPDMTAEDYLYLLYCMRTYGKSDTVLKIQRGEIQLSPVEQRTKKEVFEKFSGDLNYVFNIDLMC